MILADKIISQRKKAGWSQEELAGQLQVSRQAVSKWEGAQSVPDMDKVVQMSRLFGVTTDYLLKDELEDPEPAEGLPASPLRRVSMEQAAEYLSRRRAAAPRMALATLLCILSPTALLLLAALSELAAFPLSENAAAGIGLCVLLALVAVGVALFLSCAAAVRDYAFLDSEPFETAYGVAGMVRERRQAFQPACTRLNILGTALCILAAAPLLLATCLEASDVLTAVMLCVLLLSAGGGCTAFVYSGVQQAAFDRLLEEGDYARQRKGRRSVRGAVSAVYWLAVTAVFLFYTFGPQGNGQAKYSWFIWAIAGVLYGAVVAIVGLIEQAINRERKNQ